VKDLSHTSVEKDRVRSGSQVSQSSEAPVEEETRDSQEEGEEEEEEEGGDQEDQDEEDEARPSHSQSKSFGARIGRESHGGSSPNSHSVFYEHTLQPSLGLSLSRLSFPFPHTVPCPGSVLGHTSFAENIPSESSSVSTPRTEQATTGLTNPADIRQGIMSTIQEISEEMENSIPSIASGALDFIHAGECVLVLGQSYTIQHFLAIAAKKIKFQVRGGRGSISQ
jgi:hypothetical protein